MGVRLLVQLLCSDSYSLYYNVHVLPGTSSHHRYHQLYFQISWPTSFSFHTPPISLFSSPSSQNMSLSPLLNWVALVSESHKESINKFRYVFMHMYLRYRVKEQNLKYESKIIMVEVVWKHTVVTITRASNQSRCY